MMNEAMGAGVATNPPYDIYIVGTGIVPAFHLTREAEAAIRSSTEVMYVDRSFGIEEFLSSICPNVTDLAESSYAIGEERIDAYRLMATRVIEAAMNNPPVTFALYGHPLVYSLPPFIVKTAAEALGLRVKVMAGISSLDTLFVDLNIDPCTHGIQMYEATDLLLRKRPIQPDVPCVIWQVGTVESRLYSESKSLPQRFLAFKNYLLNYYASDTIVTALYSASLPLIPPSIREFKIENMEDNADFLHQGVTLYIHPATARPVADEMMLASLDRPEYLDELTVTE